ncbi:MAG: hypothetical protein JNK18_16625 [Cyclobacteriaceae bacterium]|nr:hypothetical protein [Cyclobacteriaceae bacterium]
MKKSLKMAFAAGLCAFFALTLTFCGPKPAETTENKDTVVVEPAPVDTVAADTTKADTTATAQ